MRPRTSKRRTLNSGVRRRIGERITLARRFLVRQAGHAARGLPLVVGALWILAAGEGLTQARSAGTRGADSARPARVAKRARVLDPILGRRPQGGVIEDAVFDFEVRAFFNADYEVGWLTRGDEFHVWLGAGEVAKRVALSHGQTVDPAVRHVGTGRISRASEDPAALVPIDTLAVEPSARSAAPRASRWLIHFRKTPVLIALDARDYPGTTTPPGSGFRAVPPPW
jgi:hypothetical protein